jgi:IclR family KDG regulon transcriptional repressor
VYELGSSVSTYTVLHEASAPIMEQLRAATKGTVQIAVLDGHDAVYVERRETAVTLRLFGRLGHRLPANVTASGKLLLAFLPDDRLAQVLSDWKLLKRTEQSIDDLALLRSQLTVIRDRGWSENLNETELGLASVAAPIFGEAGDVTASISVVVSLSQVPPEALRRLARPCLDAGLAISRRLGHRTTSTERQ